MWERSPPAVGTDAAGVSAVVIFGPRAFPFFLFIHFQYSQYLIDIAGSVQRLHGGLVGGAAGLVLSLGGQAVDLREKGKVSTER